MLKTVIPSRSTNLGQLSAHVHQLSTKALLLLLLKACTGGQPSDIGVFGRGAKTLQMPIDQLGESTGEVSIPLADEQAL